MKTFQNTFVRGPSPTYSDEANSDNVISATLPIGTFQLNPDHMKQDTRLETTMQELYTGPQHSSHQQYVAKNGHLVRQGRNTFAFWTIVIILLVLTIGNLLLTFSIIGVLHLGKGIYGMELVPEEDVIKFYGETDLDRVYVKNVGQLEGFADEPVTIVGDDGPVYVRMHHRNSQSSNRMVIDKDGVQFKGMNTFEIKGPKGGESIFTTHRPHYNMPDGAEKLISKTNSASRIVSPLDETLTISSSDNRLSIKGSEGIHLDASGVYMQAEQNIFINSTQGSTYIEGGSSGIYLDMDKIPIVNTEMGLRTGSVQYKICICMPQGIVFRIAIPRVHNGSKVSCVHFSSKHDPCVPN